MRILVISHYFEPDITAAAYRITETCELLRSSGHDVKVVTPYPHKNSRLTTDKLFYKKDWVTRVPIKKYREGGIADYLLHYLSFFFSGFLAALYVSLKWRPTIVWSTAPPLFTGLLGVVVAFLVRAKNVLDIRDVWPDSAVAAGQIKQDGIPYRLGRMLESFIYSRAVAITCVSDMMSAYIQSRSPRTPVTTVYNGIKQSFISTDSEQLCIEKRIVYAGNLGRVQGLMSLLSAFSILVESGYDRGRNLILVGDGVIKKELQQRISELNLKNRVQLIDPIPKAELMSFISKSEILYIGLKTHSALELTIPSKLFDYLSVGRPILAVIRGQGASLLRSCADNVVVETEDEQLIASGMEKIIESASKTKFVAGNIALIGKRFTREHNTNVLERVFYQLRDTSG